jgi:TRAP transporter TAXI family solute receptor
MISEPPGAAPCGQGGTCGVPGLIAAAVSTQGSPDNLRKMATGAVELALCQADVARDALKGEGAFARQPIPSLRAIGNLFPEPVHVIVRIGGIRTVSDLRGRRVSLGEANSGTQAAARLVLQAYGLRIRDIEPVYERLARSVDMLIAGDLDALFMVGGAPVAGVALAAETIPIALLPIADRQAERIIGAQPQFFRSNIDSGAYHGVPATPTVAVRAQFLVLASVSDDLVFAITRALWDARNRKLLDAIPIGIQIRRDEAIENLSVPLHPGARRYYSDSRTPPPGER